MQIASGSDMLSSMRISTCKSHSYKEPMVLSTVLRLTVPLHLFNFNFWLCWCVGTAVRLGADCQRLQYVGVDIYLCHRIFFSWESCGFSDSLAMWCPRSFSTSTSGHAGVAHGMATSTSLVLPITALQFLLVGLTFISAWTLAMNFISTIQLGGVYGDKITVQCFGSPAGHRCIPVGHSPGSTEE